MEFVLSSEHVRYALRQLATRAGIQETGMKEFGSEYIDVSINYLAEPLTKPDRPEIAIVPTAPSSWGKLMQRERAPLRWVPVEQLLPPGGEVKFEGKLPVLFWGAGYEDGYSPIVEQVANGSIIFYADLVASTFFMLSRWEETVVDVRDEHHRFPAAASIAFREGFLDQPIVDQYALILREWLKKLRPNWEPVPKRFSVQLSHDIDFVQRYGSLRDFARDLKSLPKATNRGYLGAEYLSGGIRQLLNPRMGQYFRDIFTLADISEQAGLRSAFYFMAAEKGSMDSGYDVSSPLVKDCLKQISSRGHEIGFHPGYQAAECEERFVQERKRLETALGSEVSGGRHHFLRFNVPNSWRMWEQNGMVYDSTLGYAEHEGFRCGTCHPFPPFDIEQDREIELLEIPLIVMDTTLRLYRNLSPDEGYFRILELAERCAQVGGCFTLLWHNSSLRGEWNTWAPIYRRVVPALSRLVG